MYIKTEIIIINLLILQKRKVTYYGCIKRSERQKEKIITEFPVKWNIPSAYINEKLVQLLDDRWITETWNNFIDCLNENLGDE